MIPVIFGLMITTTDSIGETDIMEKKVAWLFGSLDMTFDREFVDLLISSI